MPILEIVNDCSVKNARWDYSIKVSTKQTFVSSSQIYCFVTIIEYVRLSKSTIRNCNTHLIDNVYHFRLTKRFLKEVNRLMVLQSCCLQIRQKKIHISKELC